MDSAPESFWWNTVATFLEQYHQPFQEIIRLPVVNLIEPPALNAAGKKPFPSMKQRSDMKKPLPPIRTETGALHTGPETVRKLPQRRLISVQRNNGKGHLNALCTLSTIITPQRKDTEISG
jgi:hypothetical protein